jgi:uncharacterized protein YjiS (DUF1127 family)
LTPNREGSEEEADMNSMIATFRNWLTRMRQRAELDRFSASEFRALAQDVGLAPSDLRRVTEGNPHAGELMPRRMAALGIHAEELAQALPGLYRDMQRVCAACRMYGRCKRDLDRGTLGAAWDEYCPNAGTLIELQPTSPTLH